MQSSWRLPWFTERNETAYTSVEADANKSNTDTTHRTRMPTEPQSIATAHLWLVADFLLLLVPIAFLALAALAYRLDGEENLARGRKIQEAILLSPTLFPLAFAALGGRSLKKIALWRAQEGTTLGFLEHLIGSQSLVATVGHTITLHSLNSLTCGLLLLWALSPLGGQSALRLVREANTTVSATRPIFYASVDPGTLEPPLYGDLDAMNRVNGVVAAALGTADTLEGAPVDTWNHPKIPRIDELERAEDRNDTDQSWYAVNHDANVSYASLTGVAVINLIEHGATNFTLPYEYMYFGCELLPQNNISTNRTDNGILVSYPDTPGQIQYLRGLQESGRLYDAGQFMTNATRTLLTDGTSQRFFFFYTIFNDTTQSKPQALIYGSSGFNGLQWYLFECSMKSILVEANIICQSSVCSVERIRRLSLDRSSRSVIRAPYDVVNNAGINKDFIGALGDIGGTTSYERANPVDSWIFGNAPWGNDPSTGGNPSKNWTEYVADPGKTVEMSHRLTRVFNTFWDAYRWPLAITRNDPFARKSFYENTGEPANMLTMNKTEAMTTRQIPIYRADPGWVACLVICSSVLLLLGIVSFVLSFRIMVPDIFDYVSSFTRDSPYIDVPYGGSILDGAKRARMLKRLPVQLGDTDVDAKVGYIALRSIDDAKDRQQGRVRKDRMYR